MYSDYDTQECFVNKCDWIDVVRIYLHYVSLEMRMFVHEHTTGFALHDLISLTMWTDFLLCSATLWY